MGDFQETFRLAHELAELTGETVTGAVTTAVQERLERVRRVEQPGVADRLLEIGRDTAPRLPEGLKTVEHAELLYDESGLPR